MIWPDFSTGLGNICSALAIIAAVGWLVRMLYKAANTIKKVDDALPTLLAIASEFQNNGGSTLKDSVDRIENNMVTKDELAEHTANDLAFQTRIEPIIEKAARL